MTEQQQPGAPVDTYTHGHHASVVSRHARRTAEREAAYLLPRLRPGMTLLDAGCGPGTISTGLARAVAPGEVVGIDASGEVVESACAHAAEAGVTNARFEVASVYALPYPDAAFDVAHAHQVMQHLADPVAALREMRRVLRPGGLVALRDADYATMTAFPPSPHVDDWLRVYHRVARRNGAEPDAGRRLRSWARAAGFVDIEVTAAVELMSEPGEAADWARSWAERAVHSGFRSQAIEYGIATAEEVEAIARGWREWADDPEAFFMFVHVECIGRAP